MLADTGSSLAVVNGGRQVTMHPGNETLDELEDKERFFRVAFPFFSIFMHQSPMEKVQEIKRCLFAAVFY